MNDQISQLMDGELDDEQAQRLFAALQQPEARRNWQDYHLIGDAMRATPPVSTNFMENFRARLAEEPTILAPHRLPRASTRMIALSAAASVAAVGLAVWAVLHTGNVNVPAGLDMAQAPQSMLVVERVNPYLLAHQEYSPSVDMQGMAPYIRTVSEVKEVAAR